MDNFLELFEDFEKRIGKLESKSEQLDNELTSVKILLCNQKKINKVVTEGLDNLDKITSVNL